MPAITHTEIADDLFSLVASLCSLLEASILAIADGMMVTFTWIRVCDASLANSFDSDEFSDKIQTDDAQQFNAHDDLIC